MTAHGETASVESKGRGRLALAVGGYAADILPGERVPHLRRAVVGHR